ncbi:hypothetical protein D3C74_504170 [compost metagenome]
MLVSKPRDRNKAVKPLIMPVAHNTPSAGVKTPEIISINLLNKPIFSSEGSAAAD